ncbi:beta-ketoacyl-ACP synthase [Aphanothece sacrum]|uniref:3-oxoacyl-ACP synthase n=1 Tax=Aphanothece sacrum FPU1 TaxID=1920663 RepID=A0A401ID61_APHSA|nr:beta-ketoacyl-ACP synthase [Aphanothece sacrum]GBF79243.1 3-oxoacyl-ACP synthase [Aphanothece sacrum FPU1]GBF86744.1 3-oxoacyl-ACP synthase [Aphanothece sacrum FPU3]
MDVVVTGIGLRSCLGNLAQTWQSLVAGKSGIKLQQPFVKLSPYPMGLIENKPISLSYLTPLIVADALTDAQLKSPLPDCGVVIGSSRGCQGIWEQLLTPENTLDLSNWLDNLPHQAALITARQIETNHIVGAPMNACNTGLWAISQGVELIKQKKCDRVIVGAIETPITPLTLTGFQQMGALAKTGCYPFDKRREGLVLAEGGAVFVLESAALALQRKASIYGQILGSSFTCDGYHMSAPPTDDKMALIAIEQCLERSELNSQEIDYIHAHGTSTQLNDRREAALIKSLFSPNILVSSTKGSTGHTLGASGAITVALSLMALRYQYIPPCVGLETSDFDLNLVKESYQYPLKKVLCLGFGFGGQNGVIGLGKF